MSQPSIAIVGAGIAGVVCINVFAAEGTATTVHECAGGVGGRLATTVLPESVPAYASDRGVQSSDTRSEVFRRAVDAAGRQGSVLSQPARWGHRTIGALQADSRDEARYVGLPGMGALVRSLAAPLDVHFGHAVTHVTHDGRRWTIERDGTDVAHVSFLALVLPVSELSTLFHGTMPVSLQEAIAPMHHAPCWALMMGFAQSFGLPHDGIRIDDDVLAWAARDNNKPGRVMVDGSWVVYMSPGWSAAHARDTPEQAVHVMHTCFAEALPGTPQPDVMAVHLWSYALVEQSAGVPCHWDAVACLGACGDWCEGSRVKTASLSGIVLAAKIAEVL